MRTPRPLTAAAGVVASLLVGATLDRVDVPGIDMLLQWPIFAIVFTAFAVGGVTNAINIIEVTEDWWAGTP